MAKTKSLLTAGLRGTVGGTLVFRRLNGETVVSAAPEMSSKEPSDKQKEQRERFRHASLYAQRVAVDPDLFVEYRAAAVKKGFSNVRSLIIADYFRIPEFLSTKVNTKPEGSVLETIVVDYMRVKSVTVSLRDPDGLVFETGNGDLGTDRQTWTYLVQDSAKLVAGVSFEITATDLPGNESTISFDYQA
ncbi:MAG: hypothetical protein K0M40_07705 [Prolixibacteraceae bacterium]|nr:hypothetical protein [Prolixibacteraceae bacterium]